MPWLPLVKNYGPTLGNSLERLASKWARSSRPHTAPKTPQGSQEGFPGPLEGARLHSQTAPQQATVRFRRRSSNHVQGGDSAGQELQPAESDAGGSLGLGSLDVSSEPGVVHQARGKRLGVVRDLLKVLVGKQGQERRFLVASASPSADDLVDVIEPAKKFLAELLGAIFGGAGFDMRPGVDLAPMSLDHLVSHFFASCSQAIEPLTEA